MAYIICILKSAEKLPNWLNDSESSMIHSIGLGNWVYISSSSSVHPV